MLTGAATAADDPAKPADPAPAGEMPPMPTPMAGDNAPAPGTTVAAPVFTADQQKAVDTAAAKGAEAGHNAWMLTCAALVLFMTAPGLAMFYGGLVRKKNVLSVMMQCLFLMAMMTVIWALYGYSVAFGGVNGWIGDVTEFLFMRNVETGADGVVPYEGSIPRITHMLFQGMFFIITPALICGAFAERMKFSAMALFCILWGTIVYLPLCHWVWDYGPLAYVDPPVKPEIAPLAGGALDFAGGTVVHISSGIAALVCALVIGKRLGFGVEDMRPHNVTMTAIGAAMLWVGWFGFNGGSGLLSNGLAASAFMATHFAAATGALGWGGMEWCLRGKPSVLGVASGAVAGLVCITPASGFVQPMHALVLGVLAGVICFLACSVVKARLGYDDSLDAFGVHGVGGTLGALLTGVFAYDKVNSAGTDGLWYDPTGTGPKLLLGQAVAVVVTIVLSAVVSFILLKVIDATVGLRVDQKGEHEGLDVNEHGEEGYIF
jgi:Amt family ammonium transporter